MKKIKISIIITLLIIMMLIIALVIVMKINKKNEDVERQQLSEVYDSEEISNYTGQKKATSSERVFVTTAINKYLSALNTNKGSQIVRDENGRFSYESDDEETYEEIYNMLSKEYINENGITINNLQSFIKKTEQSQQFVPLVIQIINERKENNDVNTFKVRGFLKDADFNKIAESYYVVTIDEGNDAFSFKPITAEEYNNLINVEMPNDVEKNDYNNFGDLVASWSVITDYYFEQFKNVIISSPEDMYQLLSSEYREKRFGNMENFIKYAKENVDTFKALTFSKYLVKTDNNDYMTFLCKDQYNNIYTFAENSDNYTVMIDAYTIELQDTIDKYNNGDNKTKVGMNIDKIFTAINNKDYTYVYGKLDEDFKRNRTVESFQNYCETSLFGKNSIEYDNFTEEGSGIYSYTIKIQPFETDDEENDDEDYEENGIADTEIRQKKLKIVMQLKENRDFVFSFSAI